MIFYHNEEQSRLADETRRSRRPSWQAGRSTPRSYPSRLYPGRGLSPEVPPQPVPRSRCKNSPPSTPIWTIFVNSTAAARVNGYVGGHGSLEAVQPEIDELGPARRRRRNSCWNSCKNAAARPTRGPRSRAHAPASPWNESNSMATAIRHRTFEPDRFPSYEQFAAVERRQHGPFQNTVEELKHHDATRQPQYLFQRFVADGRKPDSRLRHLTASLVVGVTGQILYTTSVFTLISGAVASAPPSTTLHEPPHRRARWCS